MNNFLRGPNETSNGAHQMIHVKFNFALTTLLAIAIFFVGCLLAVAPSAMAQAPEQRTFASADEGLRALVTAAQARDRSALASLFGPDYDQLLSGDDVEDAKDLDEFAVAARESAVLQKIDDSSYTIIIGKNNWPTPIPLVRNGGKWFFDTPAGLEEVLNRRVGENEFSAIATCRAYAVAQWEYFTESDWDHDSVAEYAQKLISDPGTHNGLYWDTSDDAKPSPLGKLVAAAQAEGYSPAASAVDAAGKGGSDKDAYQFDRAPYHGYYFKILTRQGAHAPGGKYNYLINSNMTAGYALVAYPDKWGNSGVMTFVINQQGRVYQKDLGADTATLASSMTEYNPDPSWKLVEVQP